MTAGDQQQLLLVNSIADSNGQDVDAHLENLRHRLPDDRFLVTLAVRDDDNVLLRRLDRKRALLISEDVPGRLKDSSGRRATGQLRHAGNLVLDPTSTPGDGIAESKLLFPRVRELNESHSRLSGADVQFADKLRHEIQGFLEIRRGDARAAVQYN